MRRPVRPLWVIGITWLTVCLIGAWLPTTGVWLIAIGCVVAAVMMLFVPLWRRYHTPILALLAAAAACVSLGLYETVRYQPLASRAGEEVTFRAEVSIAPDVTRLTVLSGDLPRGTQLTLVAQPIDAPLEDHDIVEATFTLTGLESQGLSHKQSKASGVWLAATPVDMSARDWRIEDGAPTWWQRLADQRDHLAAKTQGMIGGDIGAVITGICLGADEKLSHDAVSAFRSCGVSHLFAVSGLHLSVLTQVLLHILKLLYIPRRIRGAITVAAVIMFSVVVGWTPSVTRAGVLCLLVVIGNSFRRQADARNSLGLALVLLLSESPFAAYDAGLLLSFLATFGLLFFSPQMSERLQSLPFGKLQGVWRTVASGVSVTVSATLATLPVMVLYFGQVSLISILANLLMTYAASVILVLGWLSVPALFCDWTVICRPLLWIAGWLARWLLILAHGLSRLPLATAPINDGYLFVWLGGALLLGWIGYRLLRYRGVAIVFIGAVAILSVALFVRAQLQRDTVYIRSLSSPDPAVLVEYEDHAVLIMSPDEVETLYAAREALRAEGLTALSAVYLPSGDHQVLSYIPTVLGEYAVPAITPDDVERSLWDVGTAVWQESQLWLTVGDTQLVFCADSADVMADGVFHAGGLVLNVGEKPYLFKESVPCLCIKDGVLLVK